MANDITQEYWLDSATDLERAEPVIRRYLFHHCTVLRLTTLTWVEGCFLPQRKGGARDPWFQTIQHDLEGSFLAREQTNVKYNNVEQGRHLSEHTYYRLSPLVKRFLTETSLLWWGIEWGRFYGFEDPTFCRFTPESEETYELVGGIITHEPMFFLYATPPEASNLAQQGHFTWSSVASYPNN